MSRKKLNVEKKVIRLYAGDVETIQEYYPHIPYNAVLREIVRNFTNSLRSGNKGIIHYDPTALRLEENESETQKS